MLGPFKIDGPTKISLSGGRTSGYMLWRVLEANGGLPPDTHVTFANTGKECEATLEFVHQIATRWQVPVRWVEWDGKYSPAEEKAQLVDVLGARLLGLDAEPVFEFSYREVDFATASRNGEPFERCIRNRKYLPNPVTRWCTTQLKIRPMKAFMIGQGYDHWTDFVGIRADEPRRLAKVKTLFEDLQLDLDLGLPTVKKDSRGTNQRERFDTEFPLAQAGVTKSDVLLFWAKQPFDLQLREWEGNCDLCFLKGNQKRIRIIRDRPETALWWSAREREMAATFRAHGPSYDQLVQIALSPTPFDDLPPDDLGDLADCLCGAGG